MEHPRTYPGGKGGQIVNSFPQPDTWTIVESHEAPNAITPTFRAGLHDDYQGMIHDLLSLWSAKLGRNILKQRYYNGKNLLKDFGISIPPHLLDVETVVGWPQKAVDAMAVRSRFDGFTATDYGTQEALDALSRRSRLSVKYRQAVQSALIHSCCFASIMVDDNGQPRIDLHSAETAAARWDAAKGEIAYGMTIEAFENGRPIELFLHAPDAVVHTWDTGIGFWDWEYQPITMGRPTIEAFTYRPTYRRPFGQSRISRAVMSITDSAVRVALGGDVAYQFSVSPQKYLLGADADAFAQKTKWEAYIGNIFAVGRDENGDMPSFGQLTQGSMQQTVEYFRLLAARFSGETNVPISTLGVIHDQPASAEAIYAASEPLIIECEDFNEGARDTLHTLAMMAMAAEQDIPMNEVDADFAANFKNPAMPSVVSQADAMVKVASVLPDIAGTEFFLKRLGFAEDERREAMAQMDANSAMNILAAMTEEETADVAS